MAANLNHQDGVDSAMSTEVDLMRALVAEALRTNAPIHLKDLAINGHDLMAMGLQGSEIGQTLRALNELVLDQPDLNTPEALLSVVPYVLQS